MLKLPIYAMMIAFLLSCNKDAPKIYPVQKPISESVYASGILKSDRQYQAFSSVSGIIDQIFVSEGDTVKKGDPIASISNTTQKLNRENAQLTAVYNDINTNKDKLREAKLLADLARNKMDNDSLMYTRQKTLWQQQIGSKSELEQRELAFNNSKTSYYSSMVRYRDLKRQLEYNSAQAKKNLLISNSNVSDYMLRSEIDGMVYSIEKISGEVVNMQEPIAIIGDPKHFILEMQVDEYDIVDIKEGQSVKITMDSYKDKVFDAIVTKVNPLMNERTKSFTVEARFTNPPSVLYPNVSFEANILIRSKEKALIIPRKLLIKDTYVLNSKGDTVPVKTGLKDYQMVEILSGITAEDALIDPTQ